MRVAPRSGKILSHGEVAERPTDLGDVVKRVEGREADVQESFDQAVEAERNRKIELDALFRQASEKAKNKDGEDSPRNPLDDRWR